MSITRSRFHHQMNKNIAAQILSIIWKSKKNRKKLIQEGWNASHFKGKSFIEWPIPAYES